MLSLSAALVRRLLPELSEEVPRREGFRTWIETGSFYIEAAAADNMLFKNVRLSEMMPFVSFDYERFALSSQESLLNCVSEPTRPQAIGWPVTKLYYAAFYGAHSIMRGTGQSVIRIESAQAARVTRIASIYDPALQMTTGTYLCSVIQQPSLSIDVRITKLSESGGAHEQFWRSFYIFLVELAEDVTGKNEPEATALVSEISDIRDVLSSGGFHSGTWLSAIRNQITYQHKYGAWFPFQKSYGEAVDYVNRISVRDSDSVRRDYSISRDPLLAFCACCHLIALVSADLTTGLCKRLGRRSRLPSLWTRLQKG